MFSEVEDNAGQYHEDVGQGFIDEGYCVWIMEDVGCAGNERIDSKINKRASSRI